MGRHPGRSVTAKSRHWIDGRQRGIRLNLSLARVRDRAKSAIVVYLAGPEAQQRHNPRSWRTHHGASDFRLAFDVAMGLSTSGEAAHAYLDWLTVVARDEIEALWPHVEKVAQALMRERTLAAAGVKALLASQEPPCWPKRQRHRARKSG
jgi:hypothetical protein